MKIKLILAVVLLLCPVTVFAQDISIDLVGGIGTSPTEGDEDMGPGFGGTLGVTYGLSDYVKGLGARLDVSYFSWDEEKDILFFTRRLESVRIPVMAGARFNVPFESPVKVFVETGLEASIDKAKITMETPEMNFGFALIPAASTEFEESETRFGVGIGAGVGYPISEAITIGVNARYHLVTDPYLSAGAFLGYKIGK